MAIVQRIIIVLIAVVLIGFGASQMMNDRQRQGLRPHFINLHGIESPAFPEQYGTLALSRSAEVEPTPLPKAPPQVAPILSPRALSAEVNQMRAQPKRQKERQHPGTSYHRMDIDDLIRP